MVKWAREHPYKAAVLGLALLIILTGALEEVRAAENPTVLNKTPYGFTFGMADGSRRFCALDSETTVKCVTDQQTILNCKYEDEPVYFSGCKEE